MKIFYITLNNDNEAKAISVALLEKQLAVCTNWFPINCAYRWEGEVKLSAEVVLIIKTQNNLRDKIEKIISQHIGYTNFIAEINVASVNQGFLDWLNAEVVHFD
jgi:periplasmic divalent cation tolerance protein